MCDTKEAMTKIKPRGDMAAQHVLCARIGDDQWGDVFSGTRRLCDRGRAVVDAAIAHAHAGQVRKYTNRPYIEHPGRCAARMSRHPAATEAMVAAMWLHDTIEDCYMVWHPELVVAFGQEIADLVQAVTNPSKQHPDLPRARRKAMDREHLAEACPAAKIMKMIDRIDNLREIPDHEDGFRLLYLRESVELLDVICDGDDELASELQAEIERVARAEGREESEIRATPLPEPIKPKLILSGDMSDPILSEHNKRTKLS